MLVIALGFEGIHWGMREKEDTRQNFSTWEIQRSTVCLKLRSESCALPVSCRRLLWVASQFLVQGVNLDQVVKVQSSRHGTVHSCTRGGMPFVCLRHSIISSDWLSSEMHETAKSRKEKHEFFCYYFDFSVNFWFSDKTEFSSV